MLQLQQASSNDSPLIGVLTCPCNEVMTTMKGYIANYTQSYIAGSYIDWIESGGGRVIPIYFNEDWNELSKYKLPYLNGILFTGGGGGYNASEQYWMQFNRIINYTKSFAESHTNQSIPIWGTCLGFEGLLSSFSNNDTTTLSDCDAMDLSLNVDLTSEANTSQIYNNTFMSDGYKEMIYDYSLNYNVTFNDHGLCVTTDRFYSDQYLMNNFSVLGVNYDRNGTEFVSVVESKAFINEHGNVVDYGIYSVQFHPEKPVYLFDPGSSPNMKHDLKSVIYGEYLIQFFIEKCRSMNDIKMPQDLYDKNVIYNFIETYVQDVNQTVPLETVFWFPQNSSSFV